MKNMKVVTTPGEIRKLVREALGISDETSGRSGRDDKQAPGLPSSLPISPAGDVANQLSQQRPPVEDDEFVPANPKELGKALAILGEAVPQEKVAEFYRSFNNLLDKIINAESE
jgi:hypothetical protein